MTRGVDKSQAVRAVQRRLGISPAQTMVFGDYLNDLGMLGTADWSYALPMRTEVSSTPRGTSRRRTPTTGWCGRSAPHSTRPAPDRPENSVTQNTQGNRVVLRIRRACRR
ncbi:HAD hydrolase family protein [Gordonia sputi]